MGTFTASDMNELSDFKAILLNTEHRKLLGKILPSTLSLDTRERIVKDDECRRINFTLE